MTLWDSRFRQKLDPLAWELNTSLPVDRRLAKQEVRASLAWADALRDVGILNPDEHVQITAGLKVIQQEFANGSFAFAPSDEDIHTAVERRLTELIGATAGKLHTGRSRNDQVATDFRLWMLETLPVLDEALCKTQTVLLERAQQAEDILMPGYTHLQRAQPILLAHWWLSHFWSLQRDRQRLADLRKRVAILPLGSSALAGTPLPIDRLALTKALGFDAPAPNSLDAVSDRDFAVEFLFCAALIGVHLSKLAEQVVLYTSAEFGFFELSDAFSTGSSLMPQKKNPDVFELARGKTGMLLGNLIALLAVLKGLPSAYDKDLQEDKGPVFAAADALLALLPVISAALSSLTVHAERMRAAIDSSMLATDLADYLVAKNIPFRQAHALVAQAVRLAQEQALSLDELPLDAYQQLHPAFEADLYRLFDPLESVKRRTAIGGSSPEAVRAQIEKAKQALQSTCIA
jgi:argininosuccinate lyase